MPPNLVGSQSACHMFEVRRRAIREVDFSCRCGASASQNCHDPVLKLRPHPGRDAHPQHNDVTGSVAVRSQRSLLSAVIRECALASRVHSGSCASGIHLAETDSAANQFGAPDERRRPARDISVVCGPCLPLAPFVRSRNRRAIMTTADTLPGEPNALIISSIINLVCPQCGGRMSEFQCEGKCRRNWLAEWEWANHVTRSSRSRLRSHAARSMR